MKRLKILVAALAVLSISDGAVQGQPAGAPAMATPTAKSAMIVSAAFEVSDADRAVNFYTKGLGLKVGGHVEHPGVSEIILMFPGSSVSLMLTTRKDAAPGSLQRGHLVVMVPDLHALQTQIEAAGYHMAPITEQKGFKLSVSGVSDPDGNELELVQGG